MAQLSTIISSILRDMIVAQHEANMYAMSLEDVYKQNGRLEQFALPTVAVGEVELDLRYGVKSDSAQTEQYEINYPLLRKVAKQISVDFPRQSSRAPYLCCNLSFLKMERIVVLRCWQILP